MSSDDTKVAATTRAILKALRNGKKNGPLQPYLHKARWIAQSIHPFISIQRVFYAGVPEALLEDEDENGEPEQYTEEEIKAFEAIMRLERGFKVAVNASATDADTFLLLIGLISNAAAHSRSDDTGKLKSDILGYVYEDPQIGPRFPPELQGTRLVASDSKALRGFLHIDLADHLCPLKLKAQFDDDPIDFMSKVEDGTIEITANDLPSFLYETGTVYNPDDETAGLFRGYLLVRVYRHIFTGPSSAMNPKDRSKNKSKAGIYALTSVTARTIAYACVQTYIALSNMKQWGPSAGIFHLDEFYENIVSMLEDNSGTPWVKETLEWWNGQVPGLHRKSWKKTRARSVSKSTGPSPAQRIAAQLASRIPKAVSQQKTPPHSEDDPTRYEHNTDSITGPHDDSDRDGDMRAGRLQNEENDSGSSTEPESDDEEEHRQWENRNERRERRRQQKDRMAMDEDDEYGEARGRYELDGREHRRRNDVPEGRYSHRGDERDEWEVHAQDGRYIQDRDQDREGGQHNKERRRQDGHGKRDQNQEGGHGQVGQDDERHRMPIPKQGEHHRRREDDVPKKSQPPKPTPIHRSANTGEKRVRGLNSDLTNFEIDEPRAKKPHRTTYALRSQK